MVHSVHTVVETPAFLASARDEGVTEAERAEIVAYFALNPTAGELIVGAGGARKARIARRGRGKSGGYRVITFFAEAELPVFLLDIYGKSSRADLSQAERNELKKILTELPRAWRRAMDARKDRGRNT